MEGNIEKFKEWEFYLVSITKCINIDHEKTMKCVHLIQVYSVLVGLCLLFTVYFFDLQHVILQCLHKFSHLIDFVV